MSNQEKSAARWRADFVLIAQVVFCATQFAISVFRVRHLITAYGGASPQGEAEKYRQKDPLTTLEGTIKDLSTTLEGAIKDLSTTLEGTIKDLLTTLEVTRLKRE